MTNLLKYHTFIPYEDKDRTLALLNLLEQIYLSDDPLSKNYSEKNFDLDNQLAVTFGTIDDEIVLLSTLYQKPYYGNKARTMNRVWKAQSLRAPKFGKYIKDSDITSLSIVPIHLEIALQHKLDFIFISIEGGAKRYLSYLSNKLSNVTNYKWHILENQIDVTGSGSMQHITYCQLNPTLLSQTSKQQEIFTFI
jgi:hypothetical protein